ncbi:MAG: von Willebrand factor type A domain-containing protein [Candidatus Limiplasma sp.]|nr:von Willebrand factor type A domain-containing protein [Candidatus Limiplasma sp.]
MIQRRKVLSKLLVLVSAAVLITASFALAGSLANLHPFAGVLAAGDEGDAVLALQERLVELGYLLDVPTGQFDAATADAVKTCQSTNNLPADGVCNEATWVLLFSDAAVASRGAVVGTENGKQVPSATALPDMAWEIGFVPNGTVYAMSAAPGADYNTNEYSTFVENRFMSVVSDPLSIFAADVDTASYAQLRSLILGGMEIPAASVRIEEILNYFKYEYHQPAAGEPFGVTMEMTDTPWNRDTRLLLIGLQAKEIPVEDRKPQNLVFLLDVSGSMDSPDKLPLVKRAFLLLLDELEPTDTVSIVTYASMDQVLLDGEKAANKVQIMAAIDALNAGGSTAGAAGIRTAYNLAKKHFIKNGVNRVILATDGDLNVGVSSEGELTDMIEQEKQSGVSLSVLGFGYGNLKDNKLEALADHGDGNYSYIDTIYEARKALVEEIGATFQTVAKDVKLQVEFNPSKVRGYRLIGYENRQMAATDFADDTKDGGELGCGHRVTALYEIVPVGSAFEIPEIDRKYGDVQATAEDEEWLTLNVRAKEPDADESKLYTYPLTDEAYTCTPSDNLLFAAGAAEAGMLLTGSEWKGTSTYTSALTLLRGCSAVQGDVYKEEFLYLLTLLDRR